ncbi:hypothetical protein Tco_1070271 [Tanacetum coccineum]|uniref:Uncharacterized protein n=1 Tax=Tanacetum coccineum TaxID=301880 RepID=A0ABQ5HL77_9ASTR
MEGDVDINALTIDQYIALILDVIKPGIVNPKIGDDVEFEISANFMRELRHKLFTGTNDEDAYEHVHTILEIVDLFHFPGVTHDAIMLREKAYKLTCKVLTNTGEKVKTITTIGKENIKEPVPRDLPPMPFQGHVKEKMGSPYRTRETVRMNGNPEEIHNAKARDDKGATIYTGTSPVHDMDKVAKEKKHDYDIPLNNYVMQPLSPQMVHITPSGDDYVAPATNPMSNM